MKLALKVFNSINSSRMLALTFFIPLDSKPNVASCLWIVHELPSVPNTTEYCAQKHSLTNEMGIFRMRLNCTWFFLFYHLKWLIINLNFYCSTFLIRIVSGSSSLNGNLYLVSHLILFRNRKRLFIDFSLSCYDIRQTKF